MVKSRRLLGLPVIDIENGRAVGRVSRLVVDPHARRVAAMLVTTGPWAREEQVLPWGQARGVGDAAVTVRGPGALAPAASVPELLPLLRRPVRVYGARVLTEDGAYLGTVDEVLIDPATGAVTQLLLAPNGLAARLRAPMALTADRLLVMGEDAIVAREGSRPVPLRATPGRGGAAAGDPAASRPQHPSGRPPQPVGPAAPAPDARPEPALPGPAGADADGTDGAGRADGAWPTLGRIVTPVWHATRRGLEYVRHRSRSRQ